MTQRSPTTRHWSPVVLLIFTVAFCLPSVASASPLENETNSGDDARLTTSWGAPRLGGTWDFRTLTPLERPAAMGDKKVLTKEEATALKKQIQAGRNMDRRDGGARFDVERAYNNFWWDWGDDFTGDLRTSLIVDPPNGRLPAITDEAKGARGRSRTPPIRSAVALGAQIDGPEYVGLSERCLIGFNAGPPMQPSAYNNNIRIVQTPDYVVIVNEMIHDARIVPLLTSAPFPKSMQRWMGESRGRWDGDTLVVETTHFTDKTPAYSALARGAFGTGEDLRLEERFTRKDQDTLLYEFTVHAPAVFTRAFTVAIPMKATDGRLFEYACHEGNYAMLNMLKGARMTETTDP